MRQKRKNPTMVLAGKKSYETRLKNREAKQFEKFNRIMNSPSTKPNTELKEKNPVMVEAGRKAYKTRLANFAKLNRVATPKVTKHNTGIKEKNPVMVEAGRKAYLTRLRNQGLIVTSKRTERPAKSISKVKTTLTFPELKKQLKQAGFKLEIKLSPIKQKQTEKISNKSARPVKKAIKQKDFADFGGGVFKENGLRF